MNDKEREERLISVLEKQRKNLRRISRNQIFNICIYFLSQIAVFGFCLVACWFVCVKLYNSEFFYSVFGNGYFAVAIILLVLIFLVSSAFTIAAMAITRQWIKKFDFLNRRVVWELEELQRQFLEMQRYEDSPQVVLFFDWNNSDVFASLKKYEVLKTLDPNSWNIEAFGRVIAKFNLESEIQKTSLEELSKPRPQKGHTPSAADSRDTISSSGSLRLRALQLASRRKIEKDLEKAEKKVVQGLLESQRSMAEMAILFDALNLFKDNLKKLPNVIQERVSEEILTEASHGRAFPYKFKLKGDDNQYAAVTKYLGSTQMLVKWFSNTNTLPAKYELKTIHLNKLGYVGGSDPFAGYSARNPGTALRANLLRGWVIETLCKSKSAKALANFAQKNELKITITFSFSSSDDGRSIISYSVDEMKEHKRSNDLNFEVIYFSNGICY